MTTTAVEALFHPHTNNRTTTPLTFPTLHALEEYTAVHLLYVLGLSSPTVALKLSQEALRDLQTSNTLSIKEEKGHIVVCKGPSYSDDNAILAFALPTTADLSTEETTQELFSEDVRQNLLQLVLSAPIGCSVLEFTLWEECRYADLVSGTAEGDTSVYPSLLDFILAHGTELKKLREHVIYYHPAGSDDCFAIPCMAQFNRPISSLDDTFVEAYKKKDFLTVAAWCLSATLGLW